MAVFQVLVLLVLCMVLGTRGQTRCGSIYSVEQALACCTPATTSPVLGARCCLEDSKCLCSTTYNVYAQGIPGCPPTETAASTATTPPAITAPTTTTTPPTTTMASLCPIPTRLPGQCLLDSVLLNPCEDKGVVGFAWKGPDTNYTWAHMCNGVYLWESRLNMRVMRTMEWCWVKVATTLKMSQSEVQLTHHGLTIPFADYNWESITMIDNVTTLVVNKFLDVLLAYGRDPTFTFDPSCSNVACMNTQRITQQLNDRDCYIASYGKNETNGGAYPDLTYWDKPNRVKVKLISSQRKPSPCDSLDTASSYEFPDRSICLRAKKGGVNCGETVDSAPVFCRSRETGEDVFIAFTVPLNEDCDGTVQYFWGVEVL